MQNKFRFQPAFAALLAGFCCLLIAVSNAFAQNRQPLFRLLDAPRVVGESEKSSLASVRESEIKINLKDALIADAPRLEIPLFDGVTYQAVRFSTEKRAAADFVWHGKITVGKTNGDVILTFKNNFVSGLIYAGKQVYEIVPKGDKQILVELNQSLFPDCGGAPSAETIENKTENSNVAPNAGVDSGDRIDVLILYTTAVKNSLGGEAQAQAFSQQAINVTNAAYLNSKVRQRVRLAWAQETDIVEAGTLSAELSTLRTNATVAALRDQYKADLVALISNSTDNCGIGYLMNTISGNQSFGFTANSRTCAVGNLTLAHELGHNMGSHHNPENGSGTIFPYSYGHYINGNYRTIMSYTDPCTLGCPKAPYFSNPEISYAGFATGIPNERDNARSLNNTADVVANFRYSGASLTMNNYNGGERIPRNLSKNLTWSSDNLIGSVKIEISRDESSTWQTLIANTPNDGAQTINIYGRPTRRARLRVTSIDNPIVSDSSVRNIVIQ